VQQITAGLKTSVSYYFFPERAQLSPSAPFGDDLQFFAG
jgi:hypothetical protein